MQKTDDQSFTITPSSSVIAFLSVAQWHLLSRHETTHWGKYQNLHLSCSWTHKATLLSSVPGGPAGDRAGRMARGRRAPGVWHGDLSHMKDHLWKTWIMRKIQEFKAWQNCEGKYTGCMCTHIFAEQGNVPVFRWNLSFHTAILAPKGHQGEVAMGTLIMATLDYMTYKTANCTQVIKAGTCEMNKNFTFNLVSIWILISEESHSDALADSKSEV